MKLMTMQKTFYEMSENWTLRYEAVIDDTCLDEDSTFFDIGKQFTLADHFLPFSLIPPIQEPETYLWKKCCLYNYFLSRCVIEEVDGAIRVVSKPKRQDYTFACIRDSIGMTLTATNRELVDGLAYSQFYSQTKASFDVAKTYCFDNEGLENPALDRSIIYSALRTWGIFILTGTTPIPRELTNSLCTTLDKVAHNELVKQGGCCWEGESHRARSTGKIADNI
ncbi:hypothetical protein V499_02997 [Pseudogymnoascus sp. VKM F-103]|nr:hypothetical protein V499_02997 [Pseudogymnoascus sp. VKM F-103]